MNLLASMNLATLTYVSTLLTVLSVVLGFFGYVRGWWESPDRKEERARQKAMADALLGEAPVLDRRGEVIDPGKPGLVALQRASDDRLSKVEEAFVKLADQGAAIRTNTESIAELHAKDAEHDAVMAVIIAHTFDAAARANLEAERLKAARKNNGAIDGEVAE